MIAKKTRAQLLKDAADHFRLINGRDPNIAEMDMIILSVDVSLEFSKAMEQAFADLSPSHEWYGAPKPQITMGRKPEITFGKKVT